MGAHNISISAGETIVDHWKSYSIELDMMSAADDFSLSLGPLTQELYELVREDTEITVRVDGTEILTGFVDTREAAGDRGGGSVLEITGRDRGGRLVDESMPLTSFRGLNLEKLADLIRDPWFEEVVFSNAVNRARVRGRRARKAKVWQEPLIGEFVRRSTQSKVTITDDGRVVTTSEPVTTTYTRRSELFADATKARKVSPGEKRWDVLRSFLEPARLLAWSSADGKQLIIGLPNYEQESQYRFLAPKLGSDRAHLGNVKTWSRMTSVAERYSAITVVGASRGSSSNYGSKVTKHARTASNGIGADGIGADFQHRKTLIIADDDVKNGKDADARAAREMALLDATGEVIKLTIPGHGQALSGGDGSALFAFDTMSDVEIEEIGVAGRYMITTVEFLNEKEGEETSLTLVPEGTELTQ